MNASFVPGMVAGLAESSVVPVVVLKMSVLLALAWVADAALAGRNPRWRVALWRSTVLGLALIPGFLALPPVVTWRLARTKAITAARTPTPEPAVNLALAPAPATRLAPPAGTRPASGQARLGEPTSVRTPGVSVRPQTGSHVEAPVDRRLVADPFSYPSEHGVGASLWSGMPSTLGERLLVAWLTGVAILAVRVLLSARRLSRVLRRAREAPSWVLEECRAVVVRLGGVREFRVVSSAEVLSPCLTGLGRPVLVLPSRQWQEDERADLQAILAHELAHVRGRDLAWNNALHLASLLLWFHPLAWMVRAAHASACDAVCDCLAADLLGDVASYSRTLARLALRVAGPLPANGLAMARTSDVRRRIESLQRKVYSSPLPWRLMMPALLVVSLVLVLIGGLEITRVGAAPAQEASSEKEAPEKQSPKQEERTLTQPGQLTVHVTNGKTGEPLEGVEIAYRLYAGEKAKSGKPITGKNGTAVIPYDPGARLENFSLTLRKPRFVPAHVYLDGSKHPLVIPASKQFKLEPGTTIGGVVNDESGHPIEGATVSITMPPTESDLANYLFHIGTPKTDAQGRWRIDEAPMDLGAVGIRLEHPKFRHAFGTPTRGLDGVTAILTRGLTLMGRALDPTGKPVPGAKAVLGHDIWGTNAPEGRTDERGGFTLENCNPGPTIVTVQADGFSPQFKDVQIEEKGETAPVEFVLGPASVIRARVVDVNGKPVLEAHFAADTWRGHRSVMYRGKTDTEGRFGWKSAPSDAVQFDIFKSGYMRTSRHPIVASDVEQVVVLHPELSVSGRVTDAATGEPVPSFRIIRGMTFEGRDQVSWSRNEATEFAGGRYATRFDFPMKSWHLRVEAAGYKPAESRAFRFDEGLTTQDFTLERTAGLSGVVLLPNGKPAEGAEVALATRGVYVALRGARFDHNYNFPVTRTEPDGRFTFPPPDDQYLLIAAHDAGFADAGSDAFATTGKLVLQPWGRLVGRAMVGKRPGANLPVSYEPRHPEPGGANFFLGYGYEARTDGEGRFAFDKVVPRPGSVSRVVITEFVGGSQSHMPCWQEPYELKPGGTAEVTVGGRGRAVIGRVVINGTPETPIDWRQNSPAEIKLPRGTLGQGPRG
jgi:beta-lactamase regulating signal transducer with metallopeptidase domain